MRQEVKTLEDNLSEERKLQAELLDELKAVVTHKKQRTTNCRHACQVSRLSV